MALSAEQVVDAARPLINMCRQHFDGRDLRVELATFHEDWPTPGDVIRIAARALDAYDNSKKGVR